MLKRTAAWPRSIRWTLAVLAAVVAALAIVWVVFVPAADWLASHDVGQVTGPLRTVRLQTARDAARGRLLTLGAGLFAAGALWFTARNFLLSRRTVELTEQWQRRTAELTEEGQVTDRYTKAIEQLGSDKLDVRIGGIYALERIARDSARDHPTVMEVLAAFIREHSREQWPVPQCDDAPLPARTTRPDVQAAITVIGRREATEDHQPIDLTGANLSGADMAMADLSRVRLDGAILARANLKYSKLVDSSLTMAFFGSAFLDNADLTGARLYFADFTDARLLRADLSRARLTKREFIADLYPDAGDAGGARDLREIHADFKKAFLYDARWSDSAAVPDGWLRDPASGRLRQASESTGHAGVA